MEQETNFMLALCDEFKEHVKKAMFAGKHKNFDDHNEFLKSSLEEFTQLKDQEQG